MICGSFRCHSPGGSKQDKQTQAEAGHAKQGPDRGLAGPGVKCQQRRRDEAPEQRLCRRERSGAGVRAMEKVFTGLRLHSRKASEHSDGKEHGFDKDYPSAGARKKHAGAAPAEEKRTLNSKAS